MKITSLQNAAIKNIVKLAKSKERREQRLFVIEGARELSLALTGGYVLDSVYVCAQLFAKSKYPDVVESIESNKIFTVSPAVFEKIAYRENSDGIVAVAKPKSHALSDIKLSDNPLLLCWNRLKTG